MTEPLEEQIVNSEPAYGLILSRGHSKHSIDIVQKLLAKNPKNRLNISSALKHPWFKINFDIAQRSADGDADDKNKLVLRNRRATRRGSGERLVGGNKSRHTTKFLKFDYSK